MKEPVKLLGEKHLSSGTEPKCTIVFCSKIGDNYCQPQTTELNPFGQLKRGGRYGQGTKTQ